MKKILIVFLMSLVAMVAAGQEADTLSINEVTVVSFYRNSIDTGSVIEKDDLISDNYGQEPSHLFTEMPSTFSLSDNGTDFGYGYFRIRGLDQTRINVTLDGCPWNEAEDFGWWDKVEIINGNFLENFETVKNYISEKIDYGK